MSAEDEALRRLEELTRIKDRSAAEIERMQRLVDDSGVGAFKRQILEDAKIRDDLLASYNAMRDVAFPSGLTTPTFASPEWPIVDPAPKTPAGHLASEFHQRLSDWIENFEKELDENHEVGARLVSFGQAVVIHLERIGYWNPALLRFAGALESGEKVVLIQHVSQLSVLLVAVKKTGDEPRRVEGFARREDPTP